MTNFVEIMTSFYILGALIAIAIILLGILAKKTGSFVYETFI